MSSKKRPHAKRAALAAPPWEMRSYLPGHRAAILAKVAGERGRTYFMRQCLLELGSLAESYITELVHARPYVWSGDIETLFNLLDKVGETRFRVLLERAHSQRLFGGEYVEQLHKTLPLTTNPPMQEQLDLRATEAK